MPPVHVIGGGLAGSEAAWQLAERGHDVVVHEMRPVRGTEAHKTDRLAELVCSNTFKSTETSNAHGLLKAEMSLLADRLRTQHDPRSESAKPATALVWPGSTFPLPLEMYPGGMKLGALLLMAAAAMVLAVACANVGSLQLARSRSRQSELHTRLSLGASRLRVIRQLLTESALLGALAGATALLFTWMFLKALMVLLVDALPLELGTIVFDVTPDVRIFAFKFTFQPFGPGTPSLSVPLREGSYLIMDRAFVIDEDEPTPEILGRYGFGYSFIKNPGQQLLAYGPGEFDAAIELICFTVFRDGRTRADAVFVVNRPTEIVNIPLNPATWAGQAARVATLGVAPFFLAPLQGALGSLPFANAGFDPVSASIATLDFLSGGLAAQDLCISMEQLEKNFLLTHFMQHYQTLVGSLQTWRQVRNWLDAESLPLWVVTGRFGA